MHRVIAHLYIYIALAVAGDALQCHNKIEMFVFYRFVYWSAFE